MKRILLILLRFALLTPSFAASVEDLEYRINDNGTITIRDCNENASLIFRDKLFKHFTKYVIIYHDEKRYTKGSSHEK